PDASDALWERGGPAAANPCAFWLEHPVLLPGQPLRLVLVVDRPDRLRRVREGRIIRVDLDERQQRGEALLERKLVAELLLDQVADHPLGLRSEKVERV